MIKFQVVAGRIQQLDSPSAMLVIKQAGIVQRRKFHGLRSDLWQGPVLKVTAVPGTVFWGLTGLHCHELSAALQLSWPHLAVNTRSGISGMGSRFFW